MPFPKFQMILLVIAASWIVLAGGASHAQRMTFRELRRFDVPEARQGVAVDAEHFYAITNQAVAKYTKSTGTLVKRWESSDEIPLVHLNAGMVIDGKLHCAHSNYPGYPQMSSVETFDTATLDHIGTRSFGITDGSLTWIDRHDDAWWAVFAHYSKKVGQQGRTKGTAWTRLVKFDDNWRSLESWSFPAELIKRFEPGSNSGGMWGPGEKLYCTGHDEPEICCLALPRSGSVLRLTEVIPINVTGQAFAWDTTAQHNVLYGINRQKRQVVVLQLTGHVGLD